MRIWQFEIAIKDDRRKSGGARLLAIFAAVSFVMGIYDTHGLLSWRISPSILIPHEIQLKPRGHVFMSTGRSNRGPPPILFYGQNGKMIFNENFFSVPSGYVVALAREYTGQPVATLWTYRGNPARNVWAIDVNGERILTLRQAIINYQTTNRFGRDLLGFSLLCAAWYAIYAMEVRHIQPMS